MKNIALIIAGGVGARMGQDIPKKNNGLFLTVKRDKAARYESDAGKAFRGKGC